MIYFTVCFLFTNKITAKITAFSQVSEEDVDKIIKTSPTKSCLLDPWLTSLIKECIYTAAIAKKTGRLLTYGGTHQSWSLKKDSSSFYKNEVHLSLSRGEATAFILLDLSAAFDTINHSTLFNCLCS